MIHIISLIEKFHKYINDNLYIKMLLLKCIAVFSLAFSISSFSPRGYENQLKVSCFCFIFTKEEKCIITKCSKSQIALVNTLYFQGKANDKDEDEFSSSNEGNLLDEDMKLNRTPILGGALWCEELGTCSEATLPMKLTYKNIPSSLDWRNKVIGNTVRK